MNWAVWILLIYFGIIGFGLAVFVINSFQEQEPRAEKIGILALIGVILLMILVIFASKVELISGSLQLIYVLDVLFTLIFIALIIPTGRNSDAEKGTEGYITGKVERFDERDHMFARIRSLGNDKQYNEYYKLHPELKEHDDARRAMGGPLGIPGSIDRDNRINLAMIHSLYTFPILIGKDEIVSPKPNEKRFKVDPAVLTRKVKGFARHLGADLVGITKLNKAWVYSHQGEIFFNNWDDWGKEISLDHTWAIVIATEMDRDLIMSGPHTPATIESTMNYSQGAVITVQLAAFLADLGYKATAHHFRHYDVNVVPLAVDAGLGELGRNGYLITKEFGPRVRLVAVTTDASLVPDKPVDLGVQHFCKYCKKCAKLCPSKSIPSGEKQFSNGILRWKLNAETCSSFWAKVGTDCGICMAICPWSHPKTITHRLSTHLAARSAIARRALTWLDDFVYGSYKGNWTGANWCEYNLDNTKKNKE